MSDFWDEDDVVQGNDSGEETPDDWDIDSEEEARKKEEKAKAEEEEKRKKLDAKAKIKSREERERKAREARIAEANRIKTAAEQQEEQEKAADALIEEQFDALDLDVDQEQITARRELNDQKAKGDAMKNLATFQPKTKKDFQEFANLICNRMYEFSGSTHFNYLLEQTVRQLADRQDFNNYQSVKNMGSTIGTIGNQKMQEWKNSNKKGGKKKSKGISLGGQGKAYSDMQNLEDFDDDGDDDDFM